MSNVLVVTDSVACLPPDVRDRFGIRIIPVRVSVEGKVYRDSEDELPSDVVRSLQEVPRIDTTPWPPEFYFHKYLGLSKEADHIVHVVAFSQFTSTMSLAIAGAQMAHQSNPGLRIEVVDSATTTMAQGFVALAAARVAAEGKGIEEVVAAATTVAQKVNSVFSLDTLRYLARTGRVNKLTAWTSSLLNVKPIVGLSQGQERRLALIRSKSQCMNTLARLVSEGGGDTTSLHVAVMDIGRHEEADNLSDIIQSRFQPVEFYRGEISPVTQVVTGSGLLGIAFYTDG
ncbi:MAG: DegV family protein [Dehalococcoidia bacterium]|nr:DegV family protein [Dehalococcoidia bacterium]